MANKYHKGKIIFSLDELYYILKAGKWVYYGDRPKHPGFIISMQFKTVAQAVDKCLICEAKEREYTNIGALIDQGT